MAPFVLYAMAIIMWHGVPTAALPSGIMVAAGRVPASQTNAYATGPNSTFLFNGNTWEVGRVEPMPDGLVDSSSVQYNGQLWCIGGGTGGAEPTFTRVVTLAANRQSWQLKASLRAPRLWAVAAVLNNTIVVAGGLDENIGLVSCHCAVNEESTMWAAWEDVFHIYVHEAVL
jgi:hypothetical protein